MGYFANGTDGMLYEEGYCNRCVHMDQETGCPILLLHMDWNYEQHRDKEKKRILDMFIPINENGFSDECVMFIPEE